MTPASKRMRSVSANNANTDFTKRGPTDDSFAEDQAATVELGGGSAGSASVNSCNSASFTLQPCQHCNVATSRCCWVVSAPGPETPRPRRRRTLDVALSAPRPARCEMEAKQNPMPIRFQLQELVPQSIPAVRGQPPVAQQRKHPDANFRGQRRPRKTKSPAHILRVTDEFLTLRGPSAVPCLKLAQRPVLEIVNSYGSGP